VKFTHVSGAPRGRAGSLSASTSFSIHSTAFLNGEPMPLRFTCDGANVSPPLLWEAPPPGTRSFALIVHDPDAPAGDWVHWLFYDIPGERRHLPEGIHPCGRIAGVGVHGLNDFGVLGWGGPSPPRGRLHRYRFRLMALERKLALPRGVTRDQLLVAAESRILAEAELIGACLRR